jgi:integrase
MADTRSYGVGRVFQHPRSPFWFASWYVNGNERRRSTGVRYKLGDPVTGKRNAERALERLKKEAEENEDAGASGITYMQLRQLLIDDYENRKLRSLASLEGAPLKSLDRHFGKMTVDEITTDEVKAYLKKRKAQGRADATCNNEMAALRRMLKLGIEEGVGGIKLNASQLPVIKISNPENARQGFVEPEEFAKIAAALPEHIKPLAMFLYGSSWRSGEAKSLRWTDVDFIEGMVRLDGTRTKNKSGRVFPFAAIGIAKDALELAHKRRKKALELARQPLDGDAWPFVFSDHLGRPLGDFRKTWRAACKKAELKKPVLVHDLRRSAVRNMVAAGLGEADAMAISGHKTREVFQRYNIQTLENLKSSSAKIGAFLKARLGKTTSTK